MPYFSFNDIQIAGISTAVPKQVVKTDSYIPVFGEEVVDKFKKTVGVLQTHRCTKKQTSSDLGFSSAEDLIEKLNIERESIGAIVFVSHSPDYKRPATACVLQKRLNLSKECAAFDIGLGCSGFVYAVQIVGSLMKCSDINRALIIAAESPTKIYPPMDRTFMLMGDAGSAVLLEKKEGTFPITGILRSDGYSYNAIITPAGGSRHPDVPLLPFKCKDGVERSFYNTFMHGADVFSFTIFDVPAMIKDFFERTCSGEEDYDGFIFHQANADILKQFSKGLKLPMIKIPISLSRYGNTTCPSIPLTLCDAYGDNKKGKLKFLMCGFGVGLSLGIVTAEVDTKNIFPIIETDDYFVNADKELNLL